ncbi:MAG: ATP-grasp fold amidoligase family protein [bacterium]
MLSGRLGHATEYWKTEGPGFAARVAAFKLIEPLYPVLPPLAWKTLMMWARLGYWPNIRNPRTFNEKMAHRQLFAPHPLAPLVADKWRVRQYVAKRGLADILNEVYLTTDDPAKIPFDDLPDRFVIKANHGCGMNIIVPDKSRLDRPAVISRCREWLATKYGRASRNNETHYDAIPPLLVVERFIEDGEHDVPVDYKFYCFHGTVHMVQVDQSRSSVHHSNLYDRAWRDTGIRGLVPRSTVATPEPPRLAEMVRIAERLGDGLDFCRVDLFAPDPRTILFGEITLHPAGGLVVYSPKKADFELGKLWVTRRPGADNLAAPPPGGGRMRSLA